MFHRYLRPISLPRSASSFVLDLSTWHKGRASYTFLLYNFANHYFPPIPSSPKLQNPLKNLAAIRVWQAQILQFILGSLSTGLHRCKTFFVLSCYHLLKSFTEYSFTPVPSFTKHKQLLSACCIPIHWEDSFSKLWTDFFRVDTSKCCVH